MNVLLSAARDAFQAAQNRRAKGSLVTSPLHLTTDTQGETALHLAARFRQVSAMGLLLEYDSFFHRALQGSTIYGRLVDVQNKFGWTALHSAVDRAHRGAVSLLVHHDADVNAADIFGNTPMHLAARGIDHQILADLLTAKEAGVGAVNVQGRTPLHFASACVRPSAVSFLLNDGADVLAADVFKNQAIDVLGNLEACNPSEALNAGLCDDGRRPDMCPVTLGSKTELLETEMLLQVAVKNRNGTHLCLGPCTDPFQDNVPLGSRQMNNSVSS